MPKKHLLSVDFDSPPYLDLLAGIHRKFIETDTTLHILCFCKDARIGPGTFYNISRRKPVRLYTLFRYLCGICRCTTEEEFCRIMKDFWKVFHRLCNETDSPSLCHPEHREGSR